MRDTVRAAARGGNNGLGLWVGQQPVGFSDRHVYYGGKCRALPWDWAQHNGAVTLRWPERVLQTEQRASRESSFDLLWPQN